MISLYKFSLEETFKQQNDLKEGIMTTFRHSNGKKERRFFEKNATVETLYDYIWMDKNPANHFYLVNAAGKEKLLDVTIPLEALVDEDG